MCKLFLMEIWCVHCMDLSGLKLICVNCSHFSQQHHHHHHHHETYTFIISPVLMNKLQLNWWNKYFKFQLQFIIMDSWKSYFNAMFLTNEKWCKKKNHPSSTADPSRKYTHRKQRRWAAPKTIIITLVVRSHFIVRLLKKKFIVCNAKSACWNAKVAINVKLSENTNRLIFDCYR